MRLDEHPGQHELVTTPSGKPAVLLVTKGLDIGGIERIVVDLAVGLHPRGIAIEVAVVNGRRDRLAPLIEHAGVPVHRLDGSDRIGWRAKRQLQRLVRAPRFDVVQSTGPSRQ